MRKLLNRKIAEQDGKCAICHTAFTHYCEIVPDHIEPKGMGGAWRDDSPRQCSGRSSAVQSAQGVAKVTSRPSPLMSVSTISNLWSPASGVSRPCEARAIFIYAW